MAAAARDAAARDAPASDARYCASVLLLPPDVSEDQLDGQLLAKARALGVRTSLPAAARRQRRASIARSDASGSTAYEQLFSAASDGSASAYLTPHSSIFGPPSPSGPPPPATDAAGRQPKALSFSAYDKLAASCRLPPAPAKSVRSGKSSTTSDSATRSVFSITTRRGLSTLRNRIMLRKKPARSLDQGLSCFTCGNDFSSPASLRQLGCGHAHCPDCLRLKIDQASVDETKMPPRCCAPIPASTIQDVAEPASQEAFLRAVVQFSTPCALRIFCPSASCREFIPRRKHVDPKAPLTVACSRCHTRVCSICKADAHPIGKDCPEDADVAASKTGGSPGWRRCYKCRGLVDRTPGPAPLTCRCEARFCAGCGGVWDATVGCPNICGAGDDEPARRDLSDDSQEPLAAAAEREAAEARSAQHPALQSLRQAQEHEMERFCRLVADTQTAARQRQAEQAASLAAKQAQLEAAMRERHSQTEAQLDDRQIAEEMELRTALEQSERSIRMRIRHMEAYCDGLGRNPPSGTSTLPPRVVTEQNLRDLGRQYNLRDNMDRQHEAKINMMRERQAKRMEELLARHDDELEQLEREHRKEREAMETAAAREAEAAQALFDSRKARLAARWTLAIDVLCKELEDKDGAKYAPVPLPTWPAGHVPEKAS